MPDSIADIAEPKVQGELDGLRLLVEETEGNVIAFVRYERVTEREAGIRYLNEQLSIPVVERVLSGQRQNPLALFDKLPNERACVQLYDLEAALPEVAGYLNVNREAYADVPHALVFWVGEHGLREIAQNAPDFWAWRSGVFDVRSKGTGLTQSISQVALADGVHFTNRDDLERRAQLYEGLIQEYEGEDAEYVARLRLKRSGVLYWLRRLERAREEALRAKEYAEREGDEETAGQAYHQLGVVAQNQRSFEEAEEWYHKSLEIKERLGNEHEAAATYHQLGRIAQDERKFAEAKQWYEKSLEIEERQGNEHGAAQTYHNLGGIAQEQRELEEAKTWYEKSLEIKERLDDEHGAAQTYHQLGRIAEEQRELEEAKGWYEKSLEILRHLGDEHGVGTAYHQLGRIAEEQMLLEEAKQWYEKALEITEHQGEEHGAAKTYHQLGMVAQKQREFEEAKRWHAKSLEIFERQGDQHEAAHTYGQMGILAAQQDDFVEAGRCLIQSVTTFSAVSDEQGAQRNASNFLLAFHQAPRNQREEMREMWIDAGLPPEPLEDRTEQVQAEHND